MLMPTHLTMLMLASFFGALAAQAPTTCDGPCSTAFQTNHFCTACSPDGELIKQTSSGDACTIKQPFYNSSALGWTKMTYSTYGLDFAVKTTSGATVTKESFSNACNVDYSGLSGDGTGTMSSTQTTQSGNLEIKRTWELASASSAVLAVQVEFKNVGSSTLSSIESFYGTRDDWVGNTDRPTKSPAMVTSSGVDFAVSGGNAVVTKSGAEAVIIYSPHPTARGLYANYGSFDNVMNVANPSTFTGADIENDGSYAVYVNVGELAPGETTSTSYYYGVGEPTAEALNVIATEAVETAGSNGDPHLHLALQGKADEHVKGIHPPCMAAQLATAASP